ncbi:MAG: OmpA family protein [Pseudomonadota bacterium]|nr:OmpA family protein [Pseudomonadota bacterium]
MTPRSLLFIAPLVLALSACAPITRVLLLPQDGQPTASVEVHPKGQTPVVLSRPYAVAEVVGRDALNTSQTSAPQVQTRYGQLMSVQPAAEQRFTLYFVTGDAQLTPESSAQLADVLSQATARPGGEIVIIGHTDRVGSVESNDALSLQRAQAIRQLVIERGFDANRVDAMGRGEREPVVPTEDGVQEPKNRRAEIVVR